MNRFVLVFLVALLVSLGVSASAAPSYDGQLDTRHMDHRSTLKLTIEPQWAAIGGTTPEGAARAFLEAKAADFGLPADLSNLVLTGERESLIARHFTFQQMLGGLPVDHAEVMVSVAKGDGHILRAYNNTYPAGPTAGTSFAALDMDAAYDAAWRHVRAYGELRSAPKARLVYTPEGSDFRLNWVVDLDLTGPDGAWQARVDAQTGAVVELADTRLERFKTAENSLTPEERVARYSGALADRGQAFAVRAQRDREIADQQQAPIVSRINGTGVVFDPDPRTTLLNNNLQDGSAAALFVPAYFTRTLQDIAFDGTVYRLNGPWVNIINWDPPNTLPSTTTDGNWNRVRGNNAFDDAMVYFHLDQNQRYMQSLGFVGASGIQDVSIGADSDGFNGADNSAYYSGTNRLTFGHGCVDDDEDADVILHEYGHAINYDINHSWTGGDTGAMGEGWGDYWGGSYSYSTPNGPTFNPNWIYSWDGHGNGNQCWAGRIMNANGAQYVHTTFYQAHVSIPGGYQSDELWSTPLFQSMLTLVEQYGQTRQSVDTILLESQFGLGSGLKMRDLANIIIATAAELEPGGPHAAVFTAKFLVHNIILAPLPAIGLNSFAVVAEPSGNGAADPGETADLRVSLNNAGLAGATAVSAVLTTTTPGVTIVQGNATFPDVPVGGVSINGDDFTFTVDSTVACGTLINFNLQVSYTYGSTTTSVARHGQLFAGVPVGAYGTKSPYQLLPDNTGSGITSVVTISGTGATVSADFNVDVNITHTYIGDLIVYLQSPAGTIVYLHLRSGGSADNLIGNYPHTLTPAGSLADLIGQPLDGNWTLFVRDGGAGGTGAFNYWAMYDISGFNCDSGGLTSTPDLLPNRFALAQNSPNPFNPATTISFDVPANAGLVTLSIFDVSGRKVHTLEQSSLPAGHYSRMWHGIDDSGRKVSSGVYFYQLTGNGFSQTRKMVVLQ
jgi:subtilisin-like proprotein convertase family protein